MSKNYTQLMGEHILKIRELERQVTAYKEYVKFLDEEIRGQAAFLYVHGQLCPQETVDKGIELRKELEPREIENL